MIDCLRTRVRKQPIIALYFESENELKFYNLETSVCVSWCHSIKLYIILGNMAIERSDLCKIQKFKPALYLQNNDVSGLNDQLPYISCKFVMKAVIIRLIQYSEAGFSMKASLETLN